MSEASVSNIESMLRKQNEKMEQHSNQLKLQNDRMEQLIWQIVGNDRLDIEGLRPTVARLELEINSKLEDFNEDVKLQLSEFKKEVHDLKVWRQAMWTIDLKKFITKETINTVARIFIWAIGVGGGSFGIFELFNKIVNP